MTAPNASCSLSLCMIVRDEEKFLPDCMESVRGVIDQIVIVDTGSTDKTVEIAKQYGAEVYHYRWCDDFSAARNESIKYAHGDWILWLDADERLLPESICELKKLIKPETKPVIYGVHIRNLKNDDATYSLSGAHRLFTNHKGIQFSGRIHEQVSPSVVKLKGEERHSNIFLSHLGYSVNENKTAKKNLRNRKLLEKMVKETPRSAYAHYTLAQHYGLTDELMKALKHYKTAYDLNQFDTEMTASLLNAMSENLIKLQRLKAARAKVSKSITMKPIQAGGYYLLYRISNTEEKYEEAIKWLKKLLAVTQKLRSSKKTISTDVVIDTEKILFTLGGAYQKLGYLDQAITYYKKVYHNNKKNIRLLERLVELYIQQEEFQTAERYLNNLLKLTNDDPRYLDLQGLILIKQQNYPQAISVYETIHSRNPDNEKIIKRLIGLYGKIGEMNAAEQLLMSLDNRNIIS